MRMAKNKRILGIFVAVIMIAAFCTSTVSASNMSTSFTINASMRLELYAGQSGWSPSSLSFNISRLPASAVITKIDVTVGTMTTDGVWRTNAMRIKMPNGQELITPWSGGSNSTATFDNLSLSAAHLIGDIGFHATCLVTMQPLTSGSIRYDRLTITIYYI